LPKKTRLGIPFTINSKIEVYVAGSGKILVKKFLMKGLSGRKVELDEVT
jgi:hypothetical protein